MKLLLYITTALGVFLSIRKSVMEEMNKTHEPHTFQTDTNLEFDPYGNPEYLKNEVSV